MMSDKKFINAQSLMFVLWSRASISYKGMSEWQKGYRAGLLQAFEEVKRFPTLDAVEVVHGHWIAQEYEDEFLEYVEQICSNCGCPHSAESNFCSYCGAKMDDDENSE